MADEKLGQDKQALTSRKISPRLRLFANGDLEVCEARAEHRAALAVDPTPEAEGERIRESPAAAAGAVEEKAERGTLARIEGRARASLFVHYSSERALEKDGALTGTVGHRGNIAMAEVPLDRLPDLSRQPGVTLVEAGDAVRVPPILITSHPSETEAPDPGARGVAGLAERHRDGEGVLIGIIDVGGIDFAHPDFLGEDGTRIVRIWDMGGDFRPPPGGSFDYGAEFRREHLDAAIDKARRFGVSPHAIERQSQQSPGSHATHVASIAAGNNGVCRRADIACVMLSLPRDDYERRRSFYDSTRIVHAVEYLLTLAATLGEERGLGEPLPVSINISLGTNGHAHDGSAAVNRWLEHALVKPGRAISVAAGNAGQEAPAFRGDMGFVMGRIHSSGRVAARNLVSTMDWIVVGDGTVDMSENEMEIWYEPQDRFSVTVEAPDGETIGPVAPCEYIENRELPGGTFISVYNELYSPANGANCISIYLTPRWKRPFVGVKAGEWRVKLRGEDVRDGRYHAWIERDDPRPMERRDGMNFTAFPSFFSERSNVDRNSVNTLGCGASILAVGNYDTVRRRANVSSSQGPTRDERNKPELLAPGTDVVAANGFASGRDAWIGMTGTSMASPYAAGVAGLMLAVQPNLTAAQLIGIMRRTALPLDDGDFAWKHDVGFGVIDAAACVAEAARINDRKDRT